MNNIQVGDLVTSYWKGFYEVTAIIRRWGKKGAVSQYEKLAYSILGTYDPNTCGDEINPLIEIVLKYREDGTPVKSKRKQRCDSQFCKNGRVAIADKILDLEISIKRLKQI